MTPAEHGAASARDDHASGVLPYGGFSIEVAEMAWDVHFDSFDNIDGITDAWRDAWLDAYATELQRLRGAR
jgi:hypothetical protein